MGILGKRKRTDATAAVLELAPTIAVSDSAPLTVANLAAHCQLLQDEVTGVSSEAAQLLPSGHSMSDSLSVSSNPDSRCRRLLNSCRVFEDRCCSQPLDLQQLCRALLEPKPGPVTPKSKKIAQKWTRTKTYAEDDAVRELENLLGYRGEFEDSDEGVKTEKAIYRGRNHNFLPKSVPIPTEESLELENLPHTAGAPKTPRPDISYGYNDEAFTENELNTLASTPMILVTKEQPWFPFWIVEWKATKNGGTIDRAELQARRDGAAAVSAMYGFLRQAAVDEPSATDTATFTACIDSNMARIRVHWRRVSGSIVSYESDVLNEGFLRQENDMFRIRSTIHAILIWAREQRLLRVKQQLVPWANAQAQLRRVRTASPTRSAKISSPRKTIASSLVSEQFGPPFHDLPLSPTPTTGSRGSRRKRVRRNTLGDGRTVSEDELDITS